MTATPMQTESLVEFQIDGQPIKARPGENVLEVLVRAGEDISYFCYHRGLSVAASCRQCLVKVGDGPKLIPACQLKVEEGLDVRSQDEEVTAARRQMLEFTLVNHPVDCVICDKAGECSLQRHYMDWDGRPSETDHPKVDKPKKVDLGRNIILDAERCILCSRCIRFCEEVAKEPELCFAERGDREVLTTAPGKRLDNAYSLNTVDICPVGALTDKDFRFQSRVWDLCSTQSVCNGCATGCKTEIHHKDGKVYRMVPPKLWDMDLNWMCDDGRRTYKAVGENRITEAKTDGRNATLDQAIEHAANGLKQAVEKGRDRVGVVFGGDVSNEDNYATAILAFDILNASRVYLADRPNDSRGDQILRSNDPNPNRAGAKICGQSKLAPLSELVADLREKRIDALYVVSDALALDEVGGDAIANLSFLVVQASHMSVLSEKANVVLPAALWAEVDGTITNRDGLVQRLRSAVPAPGEAQPNWHLTKQIAEELGHEFSFNSAEDIFTSMKTKLEIFAKADWGPVLPTVSLRFGGRRG